MKVKNMTSPRGNAVPNQFIINNGDNHQVFQSYDSIIAIKQAGNNPILLDSNYWDYSRTTSKYLGQFLGESMADIRKKVKSGEYILINLN